MKLDYQFDHTTHLSLPDLQSKGIRSTKMLEEVFYDPDSALVEITESNDPDPVFFMIGFSHSMIPILYIFSFTGMITSLFARKATKSEIKSYFCRF